MREGRRAKRAARGHWRNGRLLGCRSVRDVVETSTAAPRSRGLLCHGQWPDGSSTLFAAASDFACE